MSTDYTLAYGTHATPAEGRCAMEWVSYLAGEPHSDDPECISPVLRAFCMTLNDSLEDAPRQRLRPYLARTIGTSDDGLDAERSWMAMDWLIRTYAPAWLALAGRTGSVERLASLRPVIDAASLEAALGVLGGARVDARAAWVRARGGTSATTWAPWSAGRAAAREAAWRSAGAAAWAAARVAVGDIACDRARAIVREIAGDAAASVAREASARRCRSPGGASADRNRGPGGASAAGRGTAAWGPRVGVVWGPRVRAKRAAARAALAPTRDELRRSAFSLLDRMLPTVPLSPPVVDDADQLCSESALRG